MSSPAFMPSRGIALYVARLFLTRSLAVLVALVLVLMTLDLLGESAKILAVPGNGEAELWHYVGLRLPLLVARFLPFSVLLGTLIAMTALNQHSEVVAMKAAGLSAHQILAPMIAASALVAVASFTFNETVAVSAAREVKAWNDADYGPIPRDSGTLSNVWLKAGDSQLHVQQMRGSGAATRLVGVTVYRLEGRSIATMIDAASAVPLPGGGWRLVDARVYRPGEGVVRKLAAIDTLRGVDERALRLSKVDPETTDIVTLWRETAELRAADRPSDEAETGLWHKVSGPLSAMLMPLLAAVAAFGLARSGQVLLRATIGMALGFAYFVIDNLSQALGNTGAYPPFLAAWAPFILFFIIGETVLIRSEE